MLNLIKGAVLRLPFFTRIREKEILKGKGYIAKSQGFNIRFTKLTIFIPELYYDCSFDTDFMYDEDEPDFDEVDDDNLQLPDLIDDEIDYIEKDIDSGDD